MSQEMKHTPEPWFCNENEFDDFIWGANREMIAESRGTGGGLPQEENRARIVACVNACAGISNENLKMFQEWDRRFVAQNKSLVRLLKLKKLIYQTLTEALANPTEFDTGVLVYLCTLIENYDLKGKTNEAHL